ncbi:hypothetical protein WJX82_007116 [Trebouxia sp. C0006]
MTCLIVADTGLAGDRMFGCNAVQDTVLQAVALSNKGISVSCNKPLDHTSALQATRCLAATPSKTHCCWQLCCQTKEFRSAATSL